MQPYDAALGIVSVLEDFPLLLQYTLIDTSQLPKSYYKTCYPLMTRPMIVPSCYLIYDLTMSLLFEDTPFLLRASSVYENIDCINVSMFQGIMITPPTLICFR